MDHAETLTVKSQDNAPVDIAVKPSTKDSTNPFVAKPVTPPSTPPDAENSHKDDIPPKTSDDSAAQQSQSEKPKPRVDIPPTTTQVKTDPNYSAVPASTDGYQDTIAKGPTTSLPEPSLSTSISPATRLKHRIQSSDELIVCPGVYDGFSARIAMNVGFETLYMVWFSASIDFHTIKANVKHRQGLAPQLRSSEWQTLALPPATTWSRMPT